MELILTARSPEILGHYMDVPIHEFVSADPNRYFVYESIALKSKDGPYHVNDVTANYIIVDGVLLYRELEIDQDKYQFNIDD